MAQNHPSDNIYNILNKLESLKPTLQEKHDATVQQIRESVEARGSITSGVSSVEKRLTERFAAESDFSKMSNAIQKTGKSKASADAITAAAGREKLGQKEMTRRAVAGKKKATHEGNVVSGAPANKSIPVGATIPGTNLKKNKQIEVEEAFNPNSVDAQQARDSKAHHHAELKKKADAGDADAQKRLGMIKKRRDADVKNFNDKMDYMEECAMCAEGTCTEHVVAEGNGDEAYVACIVQFNRSGRAMVQRTKPINHERAEEVIRNALAKNTFVHPPFMTIYPASAGKLDGSTIMAQFPDMSQKGLAEAAKWRDPKHKDKLYTQEPDDGEGYSDYYHDSRPENDPGQKHSTFDRNKDTDKLHYPYGDYQVGQKAQVGDRAKKGLLTKNAIRVVKNRINAAHGDHPRPNLPEQGVAEGFPTVADAKADHEKNKTTGKFDSKKNRDTGGTIYTRKSSTYDNGGKDKDMKKAEKKSVKESMSAVQSRFLMEASFKRIAEEHGETLEEMMAQMAKDMEHYHNTGHASHLLRDCMEIHWHNKQDVEETANRPELSDPWMGVKDAPPPASTAPTPPASTASFAHKVAGAAKNFGKKALNTLGGPDYEGSKDMLQKSMYDEELDELAELAGLTIGKRLPEASVKVDTPEVEPVNGPKEEYATMNQAPNVFGPGDSATIAGGSNGNYGGRGDNKMATRVNRPAPVVSTPSVKPVKTLESYIEAEYNSIKKQK